LYQDAQVSLRQITEASRFSDVEMLVQVDGPGAEMASRYQCAGGRKKLTWEAADGYTSDRAVRLRDFLKDAATQSRPHEQIFLVLWGEGAGVDHVYIYNDPSDPGTKPKPAKQTTTGGAIVAHDILNGGDANRYVKDVELGAILLEFSKAIGRKIDLLGFDACLMALAEVCCEVRQSVSVIVASDEEIPQQSWPYDLILRDLGRFPGMDATTLAAVIVNRYVEDYAALLASEKVSLTAIQLSESDALIAAMKKLVTAVSAEALKKKQGSAQKRRVLRARDAARTADETDYIDFAIFCRELMESFEETTAVFQAASAVLFVLQKEAFTLYHRDAGENGAYDPYGLALYFPDALPPDATALAATAKVQHLRMHEVLKPVEIHKDPPHHAKDPPHNGKFPPGSPGTITSYHILWDSYVELSFNKETAWADLVKRLLA
jgi:Clostripain family